MAGINVQAFGIRRRVRRGEASEAEAAWVSVRNMAFMAQVNPRGFRKPSMKPEAGEGRRAEKKAKARARMIERINRERSA